jgi:hypothetical protein
MCTSKQKIKISHTQQIRNKMPFQFGYIFQHAGFDPTTHSYTFESESCKAYLSGVSNDEQALSTALHMIAQGAQFIELSASCSSDCAYRIISALGKDRVVPVGTVMFGLKDSVQVAMILEQNPLVKWCFILRGAQFNSEIHRFKFTCQNAEVKVIGVEMNDFEDGIKIAEKIAKDKEADFIELCGGFGPKYAFEIRKRIKDSVPVGAEVKGNEFRQSMLDILNSS